MKKYQISCLVIATAILMSSCATIITGSKQKVSITSEPSDAKIYVDGSVIGKTPMEAKIKRKTKIIEVRKDGYEDSKKEIIPQTNGWYWGNIALLPAGLLAAPAGMWIDIATGASKKIESTYFFELKKK